MKNKRINLFDLLIVLIILGVAAAIIFRNQIRDTLFSYEMKTVAVTVSTDAMSNAALDNIVKGDKMYLAFSDEPFGTVNSVSASPVTETVIVGAEEMEALSAYYSSVKIVLLVEGYESEGRYYAKDGTELLLRGKIVLETADSRLEYTVTALESYADTAKTSAN